MKINTSTSQTLKQEELKAKGAKAPQQTQDSKDTSKVDKAKSVDVSGIKDSQLAQNLKNTNSDIGRLQVAQKSLKSIESDVKKLVELSEEEQESLDKGERDEIHTQIQALKRSVESAMKKATFDGVGVFSKNIKDDGGNVIFEATKLKVSLLSTDAKKFYDILKEQQGEIKEAIETLKEQADADTEKLSIKTGVDKVANKDVKETDGSFLKKLGSLFRVSHDTDKLSSQRVQELLA